MDVELPDGTVVTGVPEGTTQSQLASRMKMGGHDVPAPAKETKQPPKEEGSFIGQNLELGTGDLLGLPVGTARDITNLGIAAHGYGSRRRAEATGKPLPPAPDLVGEDWMFTPEWFEKKLREFGMVNSAADPETAGGRIAASAIRALPSAVTGRPSIRQIPRALMGAATAGAGGQAAVEAAPEGAEGAARVAGSLASGGRKMRPGETRSAGERAARAKVDEAYVQAREAGYPVQPREMKVDQKQVKAQQQATQDLKIKEGSPLTHESLKSYRGEQWKKGYQPVIDAFGSNALDTSLKNGAFGKSVQKLRGEFGDEALSPVLADVATKPFTAENTILQIRRLREAATYTLSSQSSKIEDVRTARLQRRLAGAMEEMLDANLEKLGKPELMKGFREARVQMAKSFDWESSIDPFSGKIDPRKFGALADDHGGTMTGKAKSFANVARTFPQAVASPRVEDIDSMFTHRVTPMAVLHPLAASTHLATKLFDPVRGSAPYQNTFVDPRAQLTPQQQWIMRMLIGGEQQQPQVGARPRGEE